MRSATVNNVRARRNHVATAFWIVCLSFLASCGEKNQIRPSGDYAYPIVHFRITDDSEMFEPAEFYLKVHSTRYPDVKILMPLNVATDFGRTSGVLELPFPHPGAEDEKLILDLIDEDELEDPDIASITSLATRSGAVIMHGANVYELNRESFSLAASDGFEDLDSKAKFDVIPMLREAWYDPYGSAEYVVPEYPPETDQKANTLTISDAGGKSRLELRFHYSRLE